jgi:hypothetical protein
VRASLAATQVRIVKERLLETFPPQALDIFLDVDEPDLDIGALERYIDRSDVVLVLATQGYFTSRNCMRELRRAVDQSKQLVCVVEQPTAAEAKKGGLTVSEIHEQLGSHNTLPLDGSLVPALVAAWNARPPATSRAAAARPACLLAEWHVPPGGEVRPGDPLCSLDWSDDGQPPFRRVVVPSTFAGVVLEHAAEALGWVPFGSPLLVWADTDALRLAAALFEHEPVRAPRWRRRPVARALTAHCARRACGRLSGIAWAPSRA